MDGIEFNSRESQFYVLWPGSPLNLRLFYKNSPLHRSESALQISRRLSTCGIDDCVCVMEKLGAYHPVYPLGFCPSYYLFAYPKKGVSDLRRMDYHNDVGCLLFVEFHRNVSTMKYGEIYTACHLRKMPHNHHPPSRPSTPNNAHHYRKYWIFLYLLFPKTDLHISVINFSYQCASCALGQSPAVSSSAGYFIFKYYSTNLISCRTVYNWRFYGDNSLKSVDKILISTAFSVNNLKSFSGLWSIYQQPGDNSRIYPQSYPQAGNSTHTKYSLYLKTLPVLLFSAVIPIIHIPY